MASKCGRAELHPHALSQFLPQRVGPDLEQGGGQWAKEKRREEVALVFCLHPTAEHHTGCLWGALACSSSIPRTISWFSLEFRWNKYPNNETLSIFMSVLLSADLVLVYLLKLVLVYLLKPVMLVVPECNYTCKFLMLSGSHSVFQMVK